MEVKSNCKSTEDNSFLQRIIVFFKKRISISIILIYSIITIIISICFYPLIPILLNYPPDNERLSRSLGTSHLLQYVVIASISIIIGVVLFAKALKGINEWADIDCHNPENNLKVQKIQNKCINLPYLVFIGQALIINIPLIPILLLVATLNHITYLVIFKILVMVFSFYSLAAVVSHIFSKKIFSGILIKTHNVEKLGMRINIKRKIFIQIIPIFLIGILFTALIGYSKLIDEKGTLIYKIYSAQIKELVADTETVNSVDDAFKMLSKLKFIDSKPEYFVQTPENEIVTSDGSKLSGYLMYFVAHPYEGERIFDIMAEKQGLIVNVKGKGAIWRIGVVFKVASNNVIKFFIVGFIALLILNIFVLYYFSKALSDEISLVAESLTEIAEGEQVDLDRKLAVTSNDELGDLVIAFNKIQEREKEYLKEKEEQQAIMVERERLASLGQLIGGIAHNMRTPIMSISGAIEGLKDLVKEYENSIGDKSVTEADHHEIAKEMTVWLEKMGPYCSYMSDILTAVKEQTVQHSAMEIQEFTIDELTKRVELLMNNELKRNCCILKTDYRVDKGTRISGDISILVQVLNNLIMNAIHSYGETGCDIEFGIQKEDHWVEFIIKDSGKGIPNDVKEKLFKEMFTTKGKQGTGLGLFISYSNIKARFKGNMWFESEEGKGTVFYVSIPC